MAKDKELELAEEMEQTADLTGLVAVTKDGETLHVHPTTVEAHKVAGWKVKE